MLLALMACACFSLNFVTAKYALRAYNPYTFCTLWFGCGAVYGFLYLAATHRVALGRQLRLAWKPLALMGLTYTAGALAGFSGLRLVDPTVAAFINRSQSAHLVLLGWLFLGERMNRREGWGLAIALSGLAITSYAHGRAEWIGVALLLFHALAYAVTVLIAKRLTGRIDPAVMTALRSLYVSLGLGIVALSTGQFILGVPRSYTWVLVSGAFFGPFLGHIFLYRSLRSLTLSQSGVCLAFQPLFVALLALVFLHTWPSLRQFIGGLLLLGGVWLLVTARELGSSPEGEAKLS